MEIEGGKGAVAVPTLFTVAVTWECGKGAVAVSTPLTVSKFEDEEGTVAVKRGPLLYRHSSRSRRLSVGR